jgi:hypothetical protein
MGAAFTPFIPEAFPPVALNLQCENHDIRHNAVFAAGIMIQNCNSVLAPHVSAVLDAVVPQLNPHAPVSELGLVDNAASTVCRIVSWITIFVMPPKNTVRFLHMLACVCMRSKAWLAVRVPLRLVCLALHVACVPRLRLRQSVFRIVFCPCHIDITLSAGGACCLLRYVLTFCLCAEDSRRPRIFTSCGRVSTIASCAPTQERSRGRQTSL